MTEEEFWSAPAEPSGDGAFGFFGMIQSSVELPLPPHSKIAKRLALTVLIPLPIISNFAPGPFANVRVRN
jgi:hypothetical protein